MRPASEPTRTERLVKNYFQIREVLAVGGTVGSPAIVWGGFVRSPTQELYARREPYACDCDTTTGPLVCDLFDFLCFQNAFVAG